MLSKEELDIIINTFSTQLRRKQIKGSSIIAKQSAELLREIVASFKKADTVQQLINAFTHFGRKLREAHPTLLFIGNIVRRVLFYIRDEFVQSSSASKKIESYSVASSSSTTIQSSPSSLLKSKSLNSPTFGDPHSSVPRTPLTSSLTSSFFSKLVDNVSHQPNLATLLEMSNETDFNQLSGPDFKANVIEQINELILELELIYKNVTEQAMDQIHTNEVILTVGMSRTVEHLFIAASEKGVKFDVIITEHAPTYDGHQMALDLNKAGISTTLISDESVYAIMSRVNKVIVGTNSVMANGGLIAPCGTHIAALAAKKHGVPFVVCNGLYKLTPLYPLDQDSFNDRYNPSEIIPYEDGTYLNSVQVCNPAFDYVPPELIDLLVTNVKLDPRIQMPTHSYPDDDSCGFSGIEFSDFPTENSSRSSNSSNSNGGIKSNDIAFHTFRSNSRNAISVSLTLLDDIAKNFLRQGNDLEALKFTEKALLLRKEMFGPNSTEMSKATEEYVVKCNILAMSFLKKENYPHCYEFLKKAESVIDDLNGFTNNLSLKLKLRAATFNNFGCFYRRRGQLLPALQYLQKAVSMEEKIPKPDNPAATHLNICAILSELGRHKEALVHAHNSLEILMLTKQNQKCALSELSMIAVTYHNIAVEHEFLRQHEEAYEYYEKAALFADQELGSTHPTTIAIKQSFEKAIEKIKVKQQLLQQLRRRKKKRKDYYAPPKSARNGEHVANEQNETYHLPRIDSADKSDSSPSEHLIHPPPLTLQPLNPIEQSPQVRPPPPPRNPKPINGRNREYHSTPATRAAARPEPKLHTNNTIISASISEKNPSKNNVNRRYKEHQPSMEEGKNFLKVMAETADQLSEGIFSEKGDQTCNHNVNESKQYDILEYANTIGLLIEELEAKLTQNVCSPTS